MPKHCKNHDSGGLVGMDEKKHNRFTMAELIGCIFVKNKI